jgi:hypothetical protein
VPFEHGGFHSLVLGVGGEIAALEAGVRGKLRSRNSAPRGRPANTPPRVRRHAATHPLAWILVQGIDPYVGLGGPISMVRVRSFHQGIGTGGILAVRSTG